MPSVQSVKFWLLTIVRYASSAATTLPSTIRLDPTVCIIIITLAKRVQHFGCSTPFFIIKELWYIPTIKRISVCSFLFSRYLLLFLDVLYIILACVVLLVSMDCARENSLFVLLSPFVIYPCCFFLLALSALLKKEWLSWSLPSFE